MRLCTELGCKRKHQAKGLCAKHYCLQWYWANRPRYQQYYQKHKSEFRAYSLKHRRAYPERIIARSRRYYAAHPEYWAAYEKQRDKKKIKAGNIARALYPDPLPCTLCGALKNIERHHPNYAEPNKIVWLCKSCHELVHSEYYKPKTKLECL